MTTWADIEQRREAYREHAIREDERRRLITWLARSARRPERIGCRVWILECAMSSPEDRPQKCRELAKRLGVSLARIYAALAAFEAELITSEMLMEKAPAEKPAKLCGEI